MAHRQVGLLRPQPAQERRGGGSHVRQYPRIWFQNSRAISRRPSQDADTNWNRNWQLDKPELTACCRLRFTPGRLPPGGLFASQEIVRAPYQGSPTSEERARARARAAPDRRELFDTPVHSSRLPRASRGCRASLALPGDTLFCTVNSPKLIFVLKART